MKKKEQSSSSSLKEVGASRYILDFLEELYPNILPITNVSDFELGVLVGQRQLIEQLKIKLKLGEEPEETIK
jgi:hypothetical protein